MREARGEAIMSFNFAKIEYSKLNAKQKENHNFLKVSGILADYGFMTMRLSDDWQGADFIAQHIDGMTFMKVQLKGRLTINKKYTGKDLFVCFPHDGSWYLYPHDEFLNECKENKVAFLSGTNESWEADGHVHWPDPPKVLLKLLDEYKIR
jgi:hypothetical protein